MNDFAPYVSSLFEIEGLTGIRFFPEASEEEREELNGYSSRGIWEVGERFYPAPCGGRG